MFTLDFSPLNAQLTSLSAGIQKLSDKEAATAKALAQQSKDLDAVKKSAAEQVEGVRKDLQLQTKRFNTFADNASGLDNLVTSLKASLEDAQVFQIKSEEFKAEVDDKLTVANRAHTKLAKHVEQLEQDLKAKLEQSSQMHTVDLEAATNRIEPKLKDTV